jgi:hypothetical protein
MHNSDGINIREVAILILRTCKLPLLHYSIPFGYRYEVCTVQQGVNKIKVLWC